MLDSTFSPNGSKSHVWQSLRRPRQGPVTTLCPSYPEGRHLACALLSRPPQPRPERPCGAVTDVEAWLGGASAGGCRGRRAAGGDALLLPRPPRSPLGLRAPCRGPQSKAAGEGQTPGLRTDVKVNERNAFKEREQNTKLQNLSRAAAHEPRRPPPFEPFRPPQTASGQSLQALDVLGFSQNSHLFSKYCLSSVFCVPGTGGGAGIR